MIENNNNKYIPVPEWNKYHEWPKIGSLRNLIFKRKTNGFDKYNVVIKVGKRVLINESNFFKWINDPERDKL